MKRELFREGPIRYIRKKDIKQSFDNRLKSINRLELRDFYDHNRDTRHIFVYDFRGKIICVLAFDDKGDHFYLNLIENNEIYEKECDEINPAPKLIRFIENIAKSFGHIEIRLNALEQLVPYYKELGYSTTSKTEKNNDYGLLVEMQKLLSS
jgi:hypothetical protein